MAKKTDPLLRKDSKGIFRLYINRDEVGKKMIRDFLTLKSVDLTKGFYLTEYETSTGVISQCYGFLTLCEYAKFTDSLQEDETILKLFNITINDILERIRADSDILCFDATPYARRENHIEYYVETVSLVLQVAIEIRKMLYKDFDFGRNTIVIADKFLKNISTDNDKNTISEIRFIESLICKTMQYLVDACLRVNGDEGIEYCLRNSTTPLRDKYNRKMIYKGWNFSFFPKEEHNGTDISLYFSNIVAEAYLTLYENFSNVISVLRSLRDKILSSGKLDILEKVNPEDFEIYLADKDEAFIRDFNFLKKNFSYYERFNKCILDMGHFIDTKMSITDTTKDFFNHNFSIVTEKDLDESSSNDALFNVLYSVNILLAAGVDLDYVDAGREVDFYEILQYTIPNVQRIYKRLLREGKDYICSQYILKFNENLANKDLVDVHSTANQAKILRKQRIVASLLMPTLIKTYNVLSKYITPYPQYEMRLYKDSILENKLGDLWLWDTEGYHLLTNYNYVYSLRNFYDYYEKYERPYALDKMSYIEEKNEDIKRVQEEYKNKLSIKEKQFLSEKEEIVTEKDLKIQELVEKSIELAERKAPIEMEIESLIRKRMEAIMIEQMNKIIQENGHSVSQDENLSTVFKRAFLSLFTEQCQSIGSIFGTASQENQQETLRFFKDKHHYIESILFETLGEVILERFTAKH